MCFDSGNLVPLRPIEVLPGDSFKFRMTALCRLATPIHPTMDNLYLESFFFFVPNRLVWDNWQRFMGEQDRPDSSTDFTIPRVAGTDTSQSNLASLWDYYALPLNVIPDQVGASALPFRGNALIWNEWFRDENLQNSLVVEKGDGPDTLATSNAAGTTYSRLLKRGKRKDYLSSSLPWPQKGPGVDLPLGTQAPVAFAAPGTPTAQNQNDNNNPWDFDSSGAKLQTGAGNVAVPAPLFADLTSATAATINDLRQAFQIQKLQERDARGGTRYTEIIRSHFQVISPDARLQRPEYLGGGHSAIQMNTVPQTSETQTQGGSTPQGNLSAYAQTTMTGHGFTKSFVEHGYIHGYVQVRADLNYQQRVDRHWSRRTKYDFYWPALQALGEQAVLNKEIYSDGSSADNQVWGYQERWAEYRSSLGSIVNQFRSAANETLDPWHYALDFGQNRPALNSTFVEDTPPVKRTIAVQNQPEFLFDAWFDIKAARPMPIYSVPGYIDHF